MALPPHTVASSFRKVFLLAESTTDSTASLTAPVASDTTVVVPTPASWLTTNFGTRGCDSRSTEQFAQTLKEPEVGTGERFTHEDAEQPISA